MRDVNEALEIFDQLTDAQKRNALAYLKELENNTRKGAA